MIISLSVIYILLINQLYCSTNMIVDTIVTPDWLIQNFEKVKIIDATFTPKAKLSQEQRQLYYGNFDKLTTDFVETSYSEEHIPGATHFSLDSGYYPSEYIRYDFYPSEIFQKYIRLLGVNSTDHIVIYSRGPAAGMMFASRVYWTFRVYGFDRVSILNGGLDAWKTAGGKVSNEKVEVILGDAIAKDYNMNILKYFEDIPFNKLQESRIDYIDVRTANQYTGVEPLTTTFPGTKATGSHVKGAINFPMANFINQNGFKSKEEIDEMVKSLGLKNEKEVIVACNTGIQASVAFVALQRSGVKVKVYNGSMAELAFRAPELVNVTGN